MAAVFYWNALFCVDNLAILIFNAARSSGSLMRLIEAILFLYLAARLKRSAYHH